MTLLRGLILIPILTGCSSLYYPEPKGTVVIEVVADIAAKCGNATACAKLGRRGDPCTVWLSERPTDNEILHEVSHCWGRVDRP
jgi:hypothetical protein